MSIQIDKSLFLPKIEQYASKKGYGRWMSNVNDLTEEVLNLAQDWFDWGDYLKTPHENVSQIDYRVKLKLYVMDHISLEDKDKAWFIPSFLWIFLAERIISYIIKLIIEHYWPDILQEINYEI